MYNKLFLRFSVNALAISLFEWIIARDGPRPGSDPQWKKVIGQAILVTVSQTLLDGAAPRTNLGNASPSPETKP